MVRPEGVNVLAGSPIRPACERHQDESQTDATQQLRSPQPMRLCQTHISENKKP